MMSVASPVRALVRAVIVLAAVTVVVALVLWSRHPAGAMWQLLLAVALVAIGDSVEMSARLGANRIRFSPSEAALVFAFVVAPVVAVVPLTAAALAASEGLRRRRSATRAAYNVATAVLAAGAGAVFLWSAGGADGDPGDWGVLVTTGLVIAAVEGALVSAAVARSTGRGWWQVLSATNPTRVAVWAVNMTLIVVALACWRWEPELLLVIAVVAAVAAQAMSRLWRRHDDRDALRLLDVATRSFPGLDENAVVATLCDRVCELLGAPFAEVLLVGHGNGRVMRRGHGIDAVWRPATPAEVDDGEQGELLVRREAGGVVVIVPLRTGEGHVGAVRVAVAEPHVSAAERHLLGVLAVTAAEALRNAQMHAALQRQTEDLRRAANEAFNQARRDPLTGLGNRTALLEAVDRALLRAGNSPVWLLLLDLDHFKDVNDTLGHLAGDELLREVAHRLRATCSSSDVVTRLGGDEFAVLMAGDGDAADVERRARALWARLREQVSVDGLRLAPEASIGLANVPAHARDVTGLLRCADVAMYEAKRRRLPVHVFDPVADEHTAERLVILAEMDTALGRNELVLHYQPQVDLVDGRIRSVEALTRWAHPRRGLLSPAAFIPVIEHSSVMTRFTETVLDTALRDAATWRAAGHHDIAVAVNVSPRNLLDDGFPAAIAAMLDRHGVPSDLLAIEVTETLAMMEMHTVEQVLADIHGLGVRISVDDFGTGYSSLTFLHRIAVDEVKVDRSFVCRLGHDDGARSIIEATIELAHRLGSRTVAEGVETPAQISALRRLDCDAAQGFHISPPLVLDDLLDRLADRMTPFQRWPSTVHPAVPVRRMSAAGDAT